MIIPRRRLSTNVLRTKIYVIMRCFCVVLTHSHINRFKTSRVVTLQYFHASRNRLISKYASSANDSSIQSILFTQFFYWHRLKQVVTKHRLPEDSRLFVLDHCANSKMIQDIMNISDILYCRPINDIRSNSTSVDDKCCANVFSLQFTSLQNNLFRKTTRNSINLTPRKHFNQRNREWANLS